MYEGLYDTRKGLSSPDAALIGAMTAMLLSPWNQWVHRRVERAHFCDEDAVHRQVSIDFTLPHWFHEIRETHGSDPKRHLVPLGFLGKGALINFSLRDEHGKALPLLTKSQNAQVASATLVAMAGAVLGEPVPEEIRSDIRQLVSEPAENALYTLNQLFTNPDTAHQSRIVLGNHSVFSEHAALLAQGFLALTMLEIRHHERRIIQLSHEVQFAPNKRGGFLRQLNRARRLAAGAPRLVYIQAASVSEAASYHLEVEAPEGHMISRLDSFRYPNLSQQHPIAGGFRRAHFHFSNVPHRRLAPVTLSLLPRKSTIIRFAVLTSLIAAAATVLVAIRYGHIHAHHGDEVATALLLAATGFVGLAVGRSGDGEMATALLFPLRVLAVVPVVLAIAAALVVVDGPPPSAAEPVLWALSAGIAVSSAILGRNWFVVWKATR